MFTFSEQDLSYQLAYDAHRGTSWTPEIRARQEQQAYVNYMADVRDMFIQWETDKNREAMAQDLEKFKEGYLKRLRAKLAADSRTLSVMITGGARFPTRRNEKACQVAHNRLEDLIKYRDKALARLKRKYNPVAIAHAPIMSDDADAITKLEAKIAQAEKRQEIMKAANKIVHKKNLTDEQKVAAMVSNLDFSEKYAWSVLAPDYMGRKGFASYELTNNNANIRRMKQRIETLKTEQEREPAEDQEVDDSLKVVEDADQNRIQLIFDGKPPANIRSKLKSLGFRWSPRNMAWQRHLNDNGRFAVEMFIEWYKENK